MTREQAEAVADALTALLADGRDELHVGHRGGGDTDWVVIVPCIGVITEPLGRFARWAEIEAAHTAVGAA